jgi:hypothetical protein
VAASGARVLEAAVAAAPARSLPRVLSAVTRAIAAGSATPAIAFVIATCAELATDEAQLEEIWADALQPHLQSTWLNPTALRTRAAPPRGAAPTAPDAEPAEPTEHHAGVQTLLRFARRLSDMRRTGASSSSAAGPSGQPAASLVPASLALRRKVCEGIVSACRAVAADCAQGPIAALGFEARWGGDGTDLCAALLTFGKDAAASLLATSDRVKSEQLQAIAVNARGSRLLQSLIDCVAQTEAGAGGKKGGKAAADAAASSITATPLGKLWQRLTGGALEAPASTAANATPAAETSAAPAPAAPVVRKTEALEALAVDRFGTFVLERLYDVSPVALKERAVQAFELLAALPEVRSHYIASKLLKHCAVEQYTYHPDDWRAEATRQANVKRLMSVILTADTAADRAVRAQQETAAAAAASAAEGEEGMSKRKRKQLQAQAAAEAAAAAAAPAQPTATTAPALGEETSVEIPDEPAAGTRRKRD